MIFTLITRFFQLLFSAVVLGISIVAIKWQWAQTVPAETSYASFLGAFGCLCGLVGVAAVWVSSMTGLFMVVFDSLTAVLFLAGGIAYAVALKGIDCSKSDDVDTWGNRLISGGCVYDKDDDSYTCGYTGVHPEVKSRCQKVEANAAFLFLGFIASLIAATLCFLAARRGKSSGRVSAV